MRAVLRIATALGAASGIVGALGTGTAAAQPVSPTLRYTCSFPTIGGQTITARISTDIPTSLAVGESSPPFAINAAATVDATSAFGLRYILGIRTIGGTLDAGTSVTAPQGEINVPVHLAVTTTSVPASGSFDIPATGTAPTLTFSKPGSGRITAGDFTLHLVPKDANGNITYPGKINVPCALNTGQDDVVSSFHIIGTRTTTGPAPSGTDGTLNGGKPTAPATATPATPHGTTGPPTSDGSGTATAMPSTTVTPDPAKSTINAAATGTTRTGSQGTGSLILLAAGILAAAIAAAAVFRFGPRLKNRRRPGASEDG